MKTGIIWDNLFLQHDTGPSHPERKERLLAIQQGLQSYPHLNELKYLDFRRATEQELGMVHSAGHISSLVGSRTDCQQAGSSLR